MKYFPDERLNRTGFIGGIQSRMEFVAKTEI